MKRQVFLNMTSYLLVNIYKLSIYQKVWCHIAESRNFMIYTWTVTQMFELSLDMDGKLLNQLTLELLSVMAL